MSNKQSERTTSPIGNGHKPPKRLTDNKKAAQRAGMVLTAKLNNLLKWKNTKKGFYYSIRRHIGRWIDQIDPIELAAIVAGTILLKPLVQGEIELVKNLWTRGVNASTLLREGAKNIALPTTGGLAQQASGILEIGIAIANMFGIKPPQAQQQAVQPQEIGSDVPEWFYWLLSFFIAFIVVKYGGQLLGLTEKGLKAIVPMFLGA